MATSDWHARMSDDLHLRGLSDTTRKAYLNGETGSSFIVVELYGEWGPYQERLGWETGGGFSQGVEGLSADAVFTAWL